MSMVSVPQYLPAGMRAFSDIHRLKSCFGLETVDLFELPGHQRVQQEVALELQGGDDAELQVYLLAHGAVGGRVEAVHDDTSP